MNTAYVARAMERKHGPYAASLLAAIRWHRWAEELERCVPLETFHAASRVIFWRCVHHTVSRSLTPTEVPTSAR